MPLRNTPIRQKLMIVILLTSGSVVILTCLAFFAYEFFTFRQTTVSELSTLGKIIGSNSTAALLFDDNDAATEILSALNANEHIVAAGIYDENGKLFSRFPSTLGIASFPSKPGPAEYHFIESHLEGFQPIAQGNHQVGTLFLRSDMNAMSERFQLYGFIVLLVIILSLLLAYLLSKNLQRAISRPILDLSEAAKAISIGGDYSMRANKLGNDEVGILADGFNSMLDRIQKTEESLKEINSELESRVAERTNELEKANKELESFSYSVSHDLRAPLRAVNGYATILEEDFKNTLNDEGKRLLGVVRSNAKKMGHLIDDLLEFSRLGKKQVTKSTINMNDLTRSVIEELNKTTQHKSCITVNDLPSVQGDLALLNQVMVNLISNAIKYSSKAPDPEISVSGYRKNGMITYFVKDNGAGFNEAYKDKLFGVFQRLHSEKEFQGTGVGLALVKRIISKHGGDVWANGETGKGATFYFSLPELTNK